MRRIVAFSPRPPGHRPGAANARLSRAVASAPRGWRVRIAPDLPPALTTTYPVECHAVSVDDDLEQQRSRLAEAQSIAHLGSWEWDGTTDKLQWSDELCRIYGLRSDRHPRSFEEFLARVHQDDRATVQAVIGSVWDDGGRVSFKHRIVRPDGSVRVLQALGEAIVGDGGQPLRMLGTGQDITARETMESELRQGNRYFELSRDLMVTSSFDGYFTSVNPAVEHILGWSAEEFLARPFIDMVHPDDRAATLAEVAKLADGQVTFSFVNRYETRDGSYRWLDWNAIVPPDEELMYASARDVTERKHAEAALAESERHTRQILETAHDAFVSIDARGLIIDWNPEAELTFGWTRAEALGRELAETIVPRELPRRASRRARALSGRRRGPHPGQAPGARRRCIATGTSSRSS